MNNPQKRVIGYTGILIGCILFMYVALAMPTGAWGEHWAINSLLVIILGIVVIAGGLIVLFSIKKR